MLSWKVLLVLKVPLAQYFQAENLFSCTASWSKPCLFLRYDRFCLRRQPAQKNKKPKLLRVHARSAAGQMHASPRWLHPPLTPHTFTLHSSLPFPPPPPSSRVRPILPPFPLLYPFSICQTNSSSTPLSPTSSPLPTPSTPHDPPSRFHTAWRYPSSTIRLNLVNHSHGRSKHHLSWLIRLIVRQFWHWNRLPFFGRVITSDWVQGVGHSPVCQILLQMLRSTSIMVSPPAWSSSAGMLSTPALFPGLSDFTSASTSSRRMGWLFMLVTGGCFGTSESPFALWLYSSEQYSVHLLRISSSSVRRIPFLSCMVVVRPCFELVRSFTIW